MPTDIARSIDILKTTRNNIQKVIDGFSLEQLNQIPEGFNNNLIWNYGHVLVTQQLLVYSLSGLNLNIKKEWIEKYRKGTKPIDSIGQEELDQLKEFHLKTPDQTREDYVNGRFRDFKTYPTSFGVILSNVEEAIYFNNVHEGMHLGIMLSLKKLI